MLGIYALLNLKNSPGTVREITKNDRTGMGTGTVLYSSLRSVAQASQILDTFEHDGSHTVGAGKDMLPHSLRSHSHHVPNL